MDDSPFCEASEDLLVYARAFQGNFRSTPAINLAHRAPRFGNTADITVVVLGTKDEQKSYIKGLLSGVVGLFVFFLVWVCFLVFFRIRGPSRYGWLSGSWPKPRRRSSLGTLHDGNPANIVNDDNNLKEECSASKDAVEQPVASISEEVNSKKIEPGDGTQDDEKATNVCAKAESRDGLLESFEALVKIKRQERRMKVVVAIACLGIIIACMMMVSKGVHGLFLTVDSAQQSLGIASALVARAGDLANRLVDLLSNTIVGLYRFLEDFNGICPNQKICDNLDRWETCKVEAIFGERINFDEIVKHFSSSHREVLDQASEAQDLIASIQNIVTSSYETIQSYDWLLRVASFFSILLAILCFGVIVSLIVNFPPRGQKWLYRFFFPTFVILVTLAFVFAIAFVITSITIADICVDSPDPRLFRILKELLPKMSPFKQQIAHYVISKCRLPPPPSPLSTYLAEGSNLLNDLEFSFFNTTATFEENCGELNETRWINGANLMSERLCNMSSSVVELRSLFQCQTWYPLYDALVHQTLCYSVDVFSWIAFSQFFVVTLAMVVVTCRVAIYRGNDDEDESSATNIVTDPTMANDEKAALEENAEPVSLEKDTEIAEGGAATIEEQQEEDEKAALEDNQEPASLDKDTEIAEGGAATIQEEQQVEAASEAVDQHEEEEIVHV